MKIPLTPDTNAPGFPIVREVESSKGGTTYTVKVFDPSGSGSCECKGFNYRHDCRHLKELRAELKETLEAADSDLPVLEDDVFAGLEVGSIDDLLD